MCNLIAENLTKPLKMHFSGIFGNLMVEIPGVLKEDEKVNNQIFEAIASGNRASFHQRGFFRFGSGLVIKSDDVDCIMLCDENNILKLAVRNEAAR